MATQTKDYYGTLGVKKTATQDEIKKRLRAFWIDTVLPAIQRRTANRSAVSDDTLDR